MRELPCLQVGNAVAVERLPLIMRLENLAQTPKFDREMVRRERLDKKLGGPPSADPGQKSGFGGAQGDA